MARHMCDPQSASPVLATYRRLINSEVAVDGIKFKIQPSVSQNTMEDYINDDDFFEPFEVCHIVVPFTKPNVHWSIDSRCTDEIYDERFGFCVAMKFSAALCNGSGEFRDSVERKRLGVENFEGALDRIGSVLTQRGAVADAMAFFVASSIDSGLQHPEFSTLTSVRATQIGVLRKCYHFNGGAPWGDIRKSGIAVERDGDYLLFESFNKSASEDASKSRVPYSPATQQRDYVKASMRYNFMSRLRDLQQMRSPNLDLVLSDLKAEYNKLVKIVGATELIYG